MNQKSFFLLMVFLASFLLAWSQTELTAEYGPPAEANTWEKFVIPLTAESFNVDESTFSSAMANITSFWIRTEMHTGNDVGGIDEVMIGETYWSYFDSSSESWSSGGDGTMEWKPTDGVNGGFLQISDWASGDWHWLIAPSAWSGDWSSLIGSDIEFWFKTDQPSYAAIVKLTTETVYRLTIGTPTSSTVALDDSLLVQLEVTPTPTEDMTINLTSSDNSCVNVPATVQVTAGNAITDAYIFAAEDATQGCESVVEATSSGYLTSRSTIKVEGYSGLDDPIADQEILIHPNPSKGKFIVSNKSEKRIERIIIYDLHANVVFDMQGKNLGNTEIMATDVSPGMYLMKIFREDRILTSKVIIE